MSLVLTCEGETLLVSIPNKPTHQVCKACGLIAAKVKQRTNMPAPTIAPNPYDTPVAIDGHAKALLDKGKAQVEKAKIKARRQAFAERVATWSPARIKEEMAKIDEAVASHEQKIAENLRQRMILEDQLASCGSDADFAACLPPAPPAPAQPSPDPKPMCPF